MDNSKPVIHPDDDQQQPDDWNYGEPVSLSAIDGKRIAEFVITYGWDRFKSECVAPDKHHLSTFDLAGEYSESLNRENSPPKRATRTFLVLDDYGNEYLPSNMEERLLGSEPYSVAVDKETGVLYLVTFKPIKLETDTGHDVESYTYAAFLNGFPAYEEDSWKVPAEYLSRLDELKSHKRPFRIVIDNYWLLRFCEREASFGDLQEQLVVDLEFDCASNPNHPHERGSYLQVAKQIYREASPWRDVPQEENDGED